MVTFTEEFLNGKLQFLFGGGKSKVFEYTNIYDFVHTTELSQSSSGFKVGLSPTKKIVLFTSTKAF